MISVTGDNFEPLGLLPAKRAKAVNWKKCLICQGERGESLRVASASGIDTVLAASQVRRDDVYDRITPYAHDELLSREISWHGSCYGSYTSKRNLSFVSTAGKSAAEDGDETRSLDWENRSSRSNTSKINWSLCMFCQRTKHKGNKTLVVVSTSDACQSIFEAAEARGDHALLTNIREVDLIAAKAKYHSACRARYVSKSNLRHLTHKEENANEECVYENAFQELLTEIQPAITSGKAYDMSFLLDRFKAVLRLFKRYTIRGISKREAKEKIDQSFF